MNDWEKLIEIFKKYGCDAQYVAESVLNYPDEDDEDFQLELIRFMD